MKERLENILGTIFGLMFMVLVAVVTFETIARKLFNFSVQGADELGGYALAVGATLAFSLAVLGRTHIRVDILHDRYPKWLQAFMNWFSALCMGALAIFLCWTAWQVIVDSIAYGSTAQTPWATPLVYPQMSWLVGLGLFALIAGFLALRATYLLVTGKRHELIEQYQPRSAKDELADELEDLAARKSKPTEDISS
jgi:TRAP-type C4-dicarboxylate transport system permease small subunit